MTKIILAPSGIEVPCAQGETVLSALEKAGYALPNNCRAGACGECKVKVLKGDFEQGFILDMALPASEREQGFGLMCMAKPTGASLEIEWATADTRPKLFPPQERMPYMVIEKTPVTETIIKLRLRTLNGPLKFWPGQYVTLSSESGEFEERCYSLANIPNKEGDLLLFVTKVQGGQASTWLHHQLREGERLFVNGPYGTFIGDPQAKTPVLCLASGSGLAPILSLTSGALVRGGFSYPATVLFSAKTQKDLFEVGYFKYLGQKFRNFKFRYTLTQESNPDGLEGRIPKLLPKLYPDLSQTSIYIAGSQAFVDDCLEQVKKLGAQDELIHKEGFVSQIPTQTTI
jgi:CDP-4-dehydro-6-deoxyglucose reductase